MSRIPHGCSSTWRCTPSDPGPFWRTRGGWNPPPVRMRSSPRRFDEPFESRNGTADRGRTSGATGGHHGGEGNPTSYRERRNGRGIPASEPPPQRRIVGEDPARNAGGGNRIDPGDPGARRRWSPCGGASGNGRRFVVHDRAGPRAHRRGVRPRVGDERGTNREGHRRRAPENVGDPGSTGRCPRATGHPGHREQANPLLRSAGIRRDRGPGVRGGPRPSGGSSMSRPYTGSFPSTQPTGTACRSWGCPQRGGSRGA